MSPRYSQLARIANGLQPAENPRSRALYRHKPTLPPVPNVGDVVAWLEWCDPNGEYEDTDLETAIELLAVLLDGAA